jgi:hypothetical protein
MLSGARLLSRLWPVEKCRRPGRSVMLGIMVGVNPVYHCDICGNAASRSLTVVQASDHIWHMRSTSQGQPHGRWAILSPRHRPWPFAALCSERSRFRRRADIRLFARYIEILPTSARTFVLMFRLEPGLAQHRASARQA